MALVPISYTISGKTYHSLVVATLQESKEWFAAENNDLPMHRILIPKFFLEDYFKQRKIEIDIAKLESAGLLEKGEFIAHVDDWKHFTSINITREVLKNADLSYDEFIDSYASYLKKI